MLEVDTGLNSKVWFKSFSEIYVNNIVLFTLRKIMS